MDFNFMTGLLNYDSTEGVLFKFQEIADNPRIGQRGIQPRHVP
jgi:hypothetical protein